jgi:hypothetical protein
VSAILAQARRHLPIFALTLIVFATLALFVMMWPH